MVICQYIAKNSHEWLFVTQAKRMSFFLLCTADVPRHYALEQMIDAKCWGLRTNFLPAGQNGHIIKGLNNERSPSRRNVDLTTNGSQQRTGWLSTNGLGFCLAFCFCYKKLNNDGPGRATSDGTCVRPLRGQYSRCKLHKVPKIQPSLPPSPPFSFPFDFLFLSNFSTHSFLCFQSSIYIPFWEWLLLPNLSFPCCWSPSLLPASKLHPGQVTRNIQPTVAELLGSVL